MTTTRKTLIVEKYSVLEAELRKHFSAELFPSLDSVDVADLVYLITMLFVGVDSEEQYRVKIRELMDANGAKVGDEAFLVVVPLIAEFVAWMKQL
jgi:hypothetical protein